MSLFGGDSPRDTDSSFSITPVPSPNGDASPLHLESDPSAREGSPSDRESPSPEPSEGQDIGVENTQEERDGTPRVRFPGADFVWRRHVKDETSLATSILDLRGDNLAAHLYNAHAWKKSLQTPEFYTGLEPYARKISWIPPNEAGQKQWYPSHNWTKWPLPPDVVPSATESIWKGQSSKEHAAPAANLNDELMALALRRIRAQWSFRKLESARIPSQPVSRQPSRSRSVSRAPSMAPRSQEHSPVATSDGAVNEGFRPVLSADDERSRSIIEPNVKATLHRLDELLMALHHNRAGHYADAHDNAALRLRSSSHSRSRSRSSIRTLLRRQSSSEAPSRHRSSSGSASEGRNADRPAKKRKLNQGRMERSRSRRRSRSRHRSGSSGSDDSLASDHLRARDWSEIVGLAALSGWPPEVISRTYERCSTLFKESMEFANFDSQGTHEARAEKVASPEQLLVPTYFCPEAGCVHHEVGYTTGQAHRFRQHLKRSHAYSPEQILEVEVLVDAPPPVTQSRAAKSNPRGWIPPDPLSCPVSDCKQSQRVYAETRRLVEHLSRTHKWDPRVSSPPPDLRLQGQVDTVDEHVHDDDVVDGVHNDGFCEPIIYLKGRKNE